MIDRPCVAIFGPIRGEQLHLFVEERTGGACPCYVGDRCPMVDSNGRSPLLPDDEPLVAYLPAWL
jgi:hypothetical protein